MRLSAAFLRDITENIRAASQHADIAGYIAYAPAGLEMLFHGMLAPGTRLVLADGAPVRPSVWMALADVSCTRPRRCSSGAIRPSAC